VSRYRGGSSDVITISVRDFRDFESRPVPLASSATMARKNNKWYAVLRGRVPDIYETWAEAGAQVIYFGGAIHASFRSRAEAEAFMAACDDALG